MTAASPFPTSSAPSHQIIKGTLVSDGEVVEDGLVAVDGDRIAYAGPASGFDPEEFDGFQSAVRLGIPSGVISSPASLTCTAMAAMAATSLAAKKPRRARPWISSIDQEPRRSLQAWLPLPGKTSSGASSST